MVTRSPVAPLRKWETFVRSDLTSVRAVRHLAADVLAGWGWDGAPLENAVIVCSELLANAIFHGTRPGDEIAVRVEELDGGCRIEVVDTRPDLVPTARIAGATEERGRGLLLVRACSADLDVVPERGRKTVSARVRNCLPGTAA
ncbi:ATP-binding protein [Kitasatospora sp. NPDC101801]|uniref:ATP-binding protein n=1 Tax=Kitasatospora sp. NPDC101801 TaxID=3364103 RepID=UPI0037FDE82E